MWLRRWRRLAARRCPCSCGRRMAASGSIAAAAGFACAAIGRGRSAARARFGALRPGPARPGSAGQAALTALGSAAEARPGRRGVCGARRQPGRPGSQRRRQGPFMCRSSAPPASVPSGQAWPCGGRHQRREMQREGHFGLRGRGQGQGRQQPARGRCRPSDRHRLRGQWGQQYGLGAERRQCNARVTRGCGRPAATVKVGQVPGRRGRQPGDADAVRGATWRRQHLSDQRGPLQRPRDTRVRAPGPDGHRQGRPGPGSMLTPRPTPSTRRTAAPRATATPCRSSTAPRATGTPAAAAAGPGDRYGRRQPVRARCRPGQRHRLRRQLVNDFNDGSVSVINGARCNAHVTSGCRRTPPAVTTGIGRQLRRGRQRAAHGIRGQCRRRHAVGDQHQDLRRHRDIGLPQAAAEPAGHACTGPGYNSFPNAFALIPRTGSAYVVNVGGPGHPVGYQHQPLQRHQHLRLPHRGTGRAGERVPAVSRPGDRYDLRRQSQQAADRRDQRRHLPYPGPVRLRPGRGDPSRRPGRQCRGHR